METERRIFLNTFVLTFGHGIAQLLNFFFVVYFARVFGAGTLGEYSFSIAAATLLAIFVSFGANGFALREISREPETESRIVGVLVPTQLLTGMAIITGVAIIGGLIPLSNVTYGMLLLMVVSRVVLRWTGLICVRFQARELMAHVSGSQAVRNLLRLLLGVALISLFMDPIVTLSAFPISALAVYAWLYLSAERRFGRTSLSLDLKRAWELAVSAWPYFSIVILGVLYARLGVILLRTMQSQTAVGYFSSAERLVAAAGLLHMMFINAVFPAMSRLAKQDRAAMSALAARCLRLLMVMTVPLATFLYLLSPNVIQFIYGAEFAESTRVLQIVVWALVFRGLNGYLAIVAMSLGQERTLARVRFVALIVFVLSATILISTWSYLGLAYAMILSEGILGAAMYRLLSKEISDLDLLGATWRTGLACFAILVAATALMDELTLPQILAIPVLLAVSMAAAGAIRLHDLRFLRQIASSGHGNRSAQ